MEWSCCPTRILQLVFMALGDEGGDRSGLGGRRYNNRLSLGSLSMRLSFFV